MKAVVIEEHGGPDKLRYLETLTPEPEQNQVRIRLKAAGINRLDFWVRQGVPAYPVKLPHILGADGAGVVDALGPEAEGVSIGERILIVPAMSCGRCSFCRVGQDNQCDSFAIVGAKHHGTYAEYVCVPDQNVIPIPDFLPFDEAAAFPLAYLTAWHMLIGKAKLKEKETVLIVGASAGVAVAAIQIAKWKKARVLAVTTSAEKKNKIQSFGADEVFVQQEGKNFQHWIHELTGKRGADVVFEHVGPATWEGSIKSLSKYGRLVTCGATSGPTATLDLRYLFSKDLSVFGARMGTQREFRDLAEVIFSGQLKPIIDRTFSLEQAADAHRYIEEKKQIGKIVLRIEQ